MALHIERDGQSERIQIRPTKVRGYAIRPFDAIHEYTHKTGTKELETSEFYGIPVEDKSSPAAIDATILDALVDSSEPMKRGELVKAAQAEIDIGRNKLRAGIDRLTRNGQITETNGARNAKLYKIRDLP